MQRCLVRIACNEKANNFRQTEAMVINAAHSSLLKKCAPLNFGELLFLCISIYFCRKTTEQMGAKQQKISRKKRTETQKTVELLEKNSILHQQK